MTYFDKLLELMNGDAKEAARATYAKCPKDFFEGAPSACCGSGDDTGFSACCRCWFRELKEGDD